MRIILLFVLGIICPLNAQSALKESIWPGNTDRFHVGEITDLYIYLIDSFIGLDLIDYKYKNDVDHIRLYVGNKIKKDTQYKNIKKVKIYRNNKLFIMLDHSIADSEKSKSASNDNIIYIGDAYFLPKGTKNITVNAMDERGVRHDYKVKRNQHKMVKDKNDIIKEFNLDKIRWQKRIPKYKTIAYAKKGDLDYITETIKEGIALSNVRSIEQNKRVLSIIYGRCIVKNENEYLTSYKLDIKNQFMAPEGMTLVSAKVKEKMQYIELDHRVLLPKVSCPYKYNQQTRVELTLSCTTNKNRLFEDKRYIYLPFMNFPVGSSGCDYDLPHFTGSSGKLE